MYKLLQKKGIWGYGLIANQEWVSKRVHVCVLVWFSPSPSMAKHDWNCGPKKYPFQCWFVFIWGPKTNSLGWQPRVTPGIFVVVDCIRCYKVNVTVILFEFCLSVITLSRSCSSASSLSRYSGTSNKGPSEIGTNLQTMDAILDPFPTAVVHLKRTTSQRRTKWLVPKCPLFGGSTVNACVVAVFWVCGL